ncbi:MAG: V-type ATP synthase subunit I [Synergistaceae bacterium]|nr:V-type ATP synthase subunit I [Synergistaceae bacterium]
MALHKSISDEMMNAIQKLGCCQFIPRDNGRVAEKNVASLKARARHLDELLSDVRLASRFVEPYVAKKEGGMAKALGGLSPCSVAELAELASEREFLSSLKITRDLEKRLSDVKAGVSRVNGLISVMSPLSRLPYSLDFYTKGTASVQGAIFQIAANAAEKFMDALESSMGENAEAFMLPAGEKESARFVSVIYARNASDELQQALSAFQASRVEIPQNLTGLASDELSRLNGELSELGLQEESVNAEIAAIADKTWKLCQYCSDRWGIEKSKLDALIEGEQTEQIILTELWAPKSCLNAFNDAVKPYAGLSEIMLVEPDEGEKPPTLLRNPKWSKPIEAIVKMYGIPTYGGFDPTSVTTPFFYAFFGICFGDAGYGLLIACTIAIILKKTKASGPIANFLKIILIGNLCAFAFGAITFSWFGDSLTSFSFLKPLGWLKSIQLLDPMSDPMTMLVVSLAIGFFHVMLGLAIAMRNNFKSGDRLAAFGDQGGWIIFLCGLVMFGLSSGGILGLPAKLCGTVAVFGALVLVATQGRGKKSVVGKLFSGILSLYGITSYLGDVLSYSRLLALGLGSAAIAMVVNLLANLVSGVPYIGILLGVAVFAMGHVFGMVINILGAFIHSMRLQYVEFYGKFYDASGEGFLPLSYNTQYVKLTD